MQVTSDKTEMIFKNEIKFKNENGEEITKYLYKIALSHKNQDGSYSQTSILCKFPKNTPEIESQTLINIKKAWIDFYFKDRVNEKGEKYKETVPYIFINEFEISDKKTSENKIKNIDTFEDDNFPDISQMNAEDLITVSDDDLPF